MTPMESLLNAIDSAHPILLPNPQQQQRKRSRPSSPQMSIESILDNRPVKRQCSPISPPPQSPIESLSTTTVTCYHASVAQKSYGSEKRFLCPPPIVKMKNNQQKNATLSMSIICEAMNPHSLLEQHTKLDDQDKGSFKYLFVTGTAKAKQFSLRINHHQQTFFSNPISIISKPSKKTSKARNISTCLFSNSLVSLFNRINSQTVRTKYLTSENNRLCAKHATWSPFEIIVLSQPYTSQPQHPSQVVVSTPITYGSEIIFKDKHTGITSPPLIIKKVDRGQIVNQALGVVSQMQKVALQLASSTEDSPLYLNANGVRMDEDEQHHHNSSAWINFISPTDNTMSDHFCWTIVGISKFEYQYQKDMLVPQEQQQQQQLSSPPPSPPLRSIIPYPTVDYIHSTHSLRFSHHSLLVGHEVWLGQSIGPLHIKHTDCSLPDIQDILLSNHDLFQTKADGTRYFELPIVLIKQQDGSVSQTGKSLCFSTTEGQWSLVDSK